MDVALFFQPSIVLGNPIPYGRVKQSWYEAAAARTIAENALDTPSVGEHEDPKAELSPLERRLHTPAIQFGNAGRSGFNKARLREGWKHT